MRFVPLLSAAILLGDVSPYRGSIDPHRLRLERVLEGGDDFVFAAACSPDGQAAAAGRRDGKIALWSLRRGGPRRLLAGHEGYVYAVAFSRGARHLASGGLDGTVRLWNTDSGRLQRILGEHSGPVHAVCFSADSSRLVTGGADGARLWRVPEGDLLHPLHHGAHVFAVAAHHEVAATAGADGAVRLWSLQTGKQIRTLPGHDKPVLGVAFSPDGLRLASVALDGHLRVWAVDSGKLLRNIDAHVGIAAAVAFAPDGLLIATAGSDGIKFWDLGGGPRGTCKPSSATATGVAFAAGSLVVGTFADNRVCFWSARATPSAREAPPERAPGFLGVSYSNDGGALIGSVVVGSQAEAVGFQAGDVIIGVDAVTVDEADDFLNFMRATFEGDELTVRIRRDGEERWIRAKLGRWN